jgi:hypothetical protein
MKQRLQSQGLQFILCPGRAPDEKYRGVYNEIYRSWHTVWTDAYSELQDASPLFSDAFTRQDFIAAIFLDGKCLAFILFRHMDLALSSTLNDSYFTQWSEIHRQKVSKLGRNILICSNLGIDPAARKQSLGFSMKHLMVGFITEIALQSAADVVLSTPRKDKGVHSAAYDWGAISIAQNINWGLDVIVDLTALVKEELLKKRTHELVPMIEKLWQDMLVIEERPIETVNSFLFSQIRATRNRKAA